MKLPFIYLSLLNRHNLDLIANYYHHCFKQKYDINLRIATLTYFCDLSVNPHFNKVKFLLDLVDSDDRPLESSIINFFINYKERLTITYDDMINLYGGDIYLYYDLRHDLQRLNLGFLIYHSVELDELKSYVDDITCYYNRNLLITKFDELVINNPVIVRIFNLLNSTYIDIIAYILAFDNLSGNLFIKISPVINLFFKKRYIVDIDFFRYHFNLINPTLNPKTHAILLKPNKPLTLKDLAMITCRLNDVKSSSIILPSDLKKELYPNFNDYFDYQNNNLTS